jgi:hypothetical protein
MDVWNTTLPAVIAPRGNTPEPIYLRLHPCDAERYPLLCLKMGENDPVRPVAERIAD